MNTIKEYYCQKKMCFDKNHKMFCIIVDQKTKLNEAFPLLPRFKG